jgi:Cysteine-rich CPXCG
MTFRFAIITCPSCFQQFQITVPPLDELPAELDYDCEVCCRPMVIQIADHRGEVQAEARGIDD